MNNTSLLQTGVALVLVIGAVLLLGWCVQRLGGPRRARDLAVVGQVSLGQRERVVVVAWDDREWLLGVAAGQVSLLGQRDAATTASDPTQADDALPVRPTFAQAFSKAFAQQLQQTLSRRKAS